MICVCNLAEMPHHVGTLAPSRLVSLVRPEEMPATPRGLDPARHLRIEIDDISAARAGSILPERPHVESLLEFVAAWRGDEAPPLLVHCVAGVSRSMAAALVVLAERATGREEEAARELRRLAPHAHPNRRLVAVADELLGLGGRLVAAREAMGPGEVLGHDGPLVRIPLLARAPAPAALR